MRLVEITEDLEETELLLYTILSHTWGPDEEEMGIQDFHEHWQT